MAPLNSASLKQRVAREAATLLYTSQEKEYKQAKQRAAQALGGIRVLPSNKEVADELDLLADETEGSTRQERLIQMRREALAVMATLKEFHPVLIGSVWRGTAHKDSDIDVVTFSAQPKTVLNKLDHAGFEVTKTEWQSAPKLDRSDKSFHIYLKLQSGNETEVVVRSLERLNQKVTDEIYGDTMTGLNHQQLEKLLKNNPLRKFTPSKRPSAMP